MHYRLRSLPRISVDSETSIKSSDVDLKCRAANIGLGGIFVGSQEEIPLVIGKVYKLSFEVPCGSATTCIVANGMAIRKSEDGVALRFLETDCDTLSQLFRFVCGKNSFDRAEVSGKGRDCGVQMSLSLRALPSVIDP